MRILLISCLILLSLPSRALEAKWLGVAGILLKDDQTTLLIDPVFTRPTLSHWLFNAKFEANQVKVKQILRELKLQRVDGIFISHCHFDHASDVAFLSAHLRAPVYGGESLKKIVHAFDATSPFVMAQDRSEFQIGRFKIKMFRRPHPAIIKSIDWHFLQGKIESFRGKFYDYREGEVWMFVVEHPEGISIFDQSSVLFEASKNYVGRVANYFLGISNPKDRATLVEENIKVLRPKRVIGIHHDFFFLESETMSRWILPTVDLAHIEAEVRKLEPKVELIVPTSAATIELNP